MDVTNQILDLHRIYGSSDNTNPIGLSSSRSLNYANGASIQKPEQAGISKIPYTFNWKDAVGLFGVENHFVKVNLKVIDLGTGPIVINTYEPALITREEDVTINSYVIADIDMDSDLEPVNDYDPAVISATNLPEYDVNRISVELINNKTGNQYIDRDLDVRLYTKDKKEWGYNKMYLNENDYFYVGFHARNTRRLPYNVSCKVGEEYLDFFNLTPEQKLLTPDI